MGSEMKTMLSFADYHNMTLLPVVNEFDYWGDIFDNWTGNGLMGNIVEDKADIGAAALYTWERMYNFLDLSKSTVRTGITCLVPAPRLAAGWLTPLYVYDFKTWLAVISMFLFSIFSAYFSEIVSYAEEKNKDFDHIKWVNIFDKAVISVAKPFVMQNVTNKEIIRGKLGRFFMALVFMTTLVLSTTYYSGYATIFTIPRYENPINTVAELTASGLFWGATQEAWIISIEGSKEENHIKLVQRFVATSEKRLRELSLTGQFAFSLERLPHGNFAVGPYIKQDVIQNFHLMKEDLYFEYCVIMARKNSILLPHIDMFVLKVFEAGLISFWQNEAATSYMDQTVQKAVKYYYTHQNKRGIVKLKMLHVEGAFGVLIFGYILALIMFLLEHVHLRFLENNYLQN